MKVGSIFSSNFYKKANQRTIPFTKTSAQYDFRNKLINTVVAIPLVSTGLLGHCDFIHTNTVVLRFQEKSLKGISQNLDK